MSMLQYLGRTYDVMAYQGVQPSGMVRLEPALADTTNPSGAICTGIQKLLQQFLIRFGTKQGSRPHDPFFGATFMEELQQGYLRTELDVQTAFSLAVGDISAQFLGSTPADAPPDEQFADATLESVTIGGGAVSLRIRVDSLAGENRVAILPLTVVV